MGRERIELEWQGGHAIKEFSDFLRSEPLRPQQFAKAKKLGLRILREVATIVTPGALLAQHRKLIAKNFALVYLSGNIDTRLQRSTSPHEAEEGRFIAVNCWNKC